MSGTQSLDAGTATGRPMLSVIAAVVRPSVNPNVSARGSLRPSAKAATGSGADRPPTGSRDIRLKSEGVRPAEIAIRLGIGRASVYRVLGEQAGGDRQEAA